MLPMLSLSGLVINVFESPKGVSKRTGEEYGGQDKVQIIGDLPLPNGEIRKEMITLTAHDAKPFQDLIGKSMSVSVGVIAQAKGQLTYFITKGSQPSLKAS